MVRLNELEKYKALYENEKDHTDTLLRIIFKMFDLLDSDKQQMIRPLLEEFPKRDPYFNPPYKFTCDTKDVKPK